MLCNPVVGSGGEIEKGQMLSVFVFQGAYVTFLFKYECNPVAYCPQDVSFCHLSAENANQETLCRTVACCSQAT